MTATPDHPARRDVADLLAECEIHRTRRSGPGGQHRNKVETTVVLRHVPTGIHAEAGERRSQDQNRREAIRRLRRKLAVEHRVPVDPESPPSELWRSRCRDGRISCNPEHDDFPAILAEALDVLEAHALDVRSAAERLGCSATQLVRLVKLAPPAFMRLNRDRERRGKHALK